MHHIVEDNLVGWSGTDDNVALTFNLRLKDNNHANNFVKIVKEFSQLSLAAVNSHTSKTEHVYSLATKTEYVLPENKSTYSSIPFTPDAS